MEPFIAGRYSGTWNSVALGITKTGFELEFTFHFEDIDETDAYAQSLIDAIYRGARCHINAQLIEYKAGSISMLWPVGGGTLGKIMSAAKPVGILASDQAQALVLTSTANTPAAAAPTSLTASKTWIPNNFNPRVALDSKLRQFPMRLMMLPSDSSGEVTCFTTS